MLSVHAQSRYEVGLEGGFLFQQYKLSDPGTNLEKKKPTYALPNGIGAFSLQVNTHKKWVYRVSVGLYAINYNYDLKTIDNSGNARDYDENLFLMGSVGYAVSMGKRFSLIPLIGLAANVRTMEGTIRSYYDVPYTTGYQFDRVPTNTLFGTANGKLDLVYRTNKRLLFSLSGNYMLGLSDRVIHQINYKIDNGSMQYASVVSRGSFLYFTTGVRYQFR